MRRLVVILVGLSFCAVALARTRPAKRTAKTGRSATTAARQKAKPAAKKTVTAKPGARQQKASAKTPSRPLIRPRTSKVTASRSPWKVPTYADSTAGDNVDGEDLEVRRAAVEALGPYNGAIVVTDAETGRILSIVNQKLAFSSGFQPCSTVKLVTALAALKENLIPTLNPFRLTSRALSSLTYAMAHSTNGYFAQLGQKLGFDRVTQYARAFGLGERAGWNIPGEQPGTLPATLPRDGGVGMMTSFGSGISLTPLQLASLIGAIANGGTLYYLQYPRTRDEIAQFSPRVKRELEIDSWLDELKAGMRAAVESGTARRAAYISDEPIYGKTGTCTDYGKSSHMGWFGSFNESGSRKLAVVVMLTGARGVSGPIASGIAGKIYAELERRDYTTRAFQTVRHVPLDCCGD